MCVLKIDFDFIFCFSVSVVDFLVLYLCYNRGEERKEGEGTAMRE